MRCSCPNIEHRACRLGATAFSAVGAFFVWVSGDVIKLPLEIKTAVALLRARSDARLFRPEKAGVGFPDG